MQRVTTQQIVHHAANWFKYKGVTIQWIGYHSKLVTLHTHHSYNAANWLECKKVTKQPIEPHNNWPHTINWAMQLMCSQLIPHTPKELPLWNSYIIWFLKWCFLYLCDLSVLSKHDHELADYIEFFAKHMNGCDGHNKWNIYIRKEVVGRNINFVTLGIPDQPCTQNHARGTWGDGIRGSRK